MRTVAYPLCCGKTIINNFGNDPASRDPDEQGTRLEVLDRILARQNRNEYECALNGGQNAVWGPLLIARGFLLVATHVNPVHNSTIYTYYKATDLVLFGEERQPACQAEGVPNVAADGYTHTYIHPHDPTHRWHNRRFRLEYVRADLAFGEFEGLAGRTHCSFNRLVPIPPAPAEHPVILMEFFANLRNIGRRGPFSALHEAREAYPRCRQFDRRQVKSDGTQEWLENVDAEAEADAIVRAA